MNVILIYGFCQNNAQMKFLAIFTGDNIERIDGLRFYGIYFLVWIEITVVLFRIYLVKTI